MGNRIRELRKERHMTMKQLGEKLGLAESTVSQYETGKRSPDNETLLKLGEIFGVTVGYILGAEEKEQPTPVSESGIEESREQFMKAAEEMKKAVEKINSGIIPKTDFQIIKTTCPIDGTEQVIYQVFYIVDGNRFPMPNNGCENYHLCDQCDKCRSDTMVKVMK